MIFMNLFFSKYFLSLCLIIYISISSLIFPQINTKSISGLNEFTKGFQLSGFVTSPYFNEQICLFHFDPDVRIFINAPAVKDLDIYKPTKLILFALPNGNTIEQTIGKQIISEDDWHFDIQHIGAQTRFLRNQLSDYNLVIAYLETSQKCWPAWKTKHPNYSSITDSLINYLSNLLFDFNPAIILTGHSGGGSFTFGYLDGVNEIPMNIERIVFLDSDYGYEDKYGALFLKWLNASSKHYLSVLAYNDSVALYNGKPFVSDTGGTWYRSKMFLRYLKDHFKFTSEENDEFINHRALNNRIEFLLKKNPNRLIFHTVQVELNGFIHSMVSGTLQENNGYKYFGERAYSQFIQADKIFPNVLMISPRQKDALTGSQFITKVIDMSFEQRESEIYNQISIGNIPNFLRKLTQITSTFSDEEGKEHICSYEVMPDYLAIGSDEDFCRIPMGPIIAQKIADLFGAVLATSKLVDDIYKHCIVKLDPVFYKPIGDENTFVAKFFEHNSEIQNQFNVAGGILGQLTGGIKKDVVLSNKIADTLRTANVVIYGWHKLDGTPIQPLTNIHKNTYVDYSHGIRLLNEEIIIDDKMFNIKAILQDPILYKLLSDENKPMTITKY